MFRLSLSDRRFLLSRTQGVLLPEELNGLLPLGPTGSRNVSGVGNASTNLRSPNWWFGSADTLFPRLTFNRLTDPFVRGDVISNPFSSSLRANNSTVTLGNTVRVASLTNKTVVPSGGVVVDGLNPRTISNLVVNSDGSSQFQLQDNPTGRISPISGAVNPLPFSNWMSQFGQFFDHGLDFVGKGLDGKVAAPLMPGDSLYGKSPGNQIVASRNITATITVGEGTTDALFNQLGFGTGGAGLSQGVPYWEMKTVLTETGLVDQAATGAFIWQGTLVLNNVVMDIAARSIQDLVANINLYTPETGVTASFQPVAQTTTAKYELTLIPSRAESFNQVSPFVDLSQNYGSSDSRTVFLREYLGGTGLSVADRTTGRLLNAATFGNPLNFNINGESYVGPPRWSDIKANALRIGITLHDSDINAIPMVAFDDNGALLLDAQGNAQLVALDKTTGLKTYIKDTNPVALNTANLVLVTTHHAFLNDKAAFSLAGSTLPNGVTVTNADTGDTNIVNPAGGFFKSSDFLLTATGDNPANYTAAMNAYFKLAPGAATFQPLDSHLIAGDGRLNENIGLTAIHEVFLVEHNRAITELKAGYGFVGDQPPGGWTWTDPLTNETTRITGEDLFQQAKLIAEMKYQHVVFDEFVRKLSPNIAAFVAVNPAIDARISSEFANAVYRLGHSMLAETVGMRLNTTAQSISITGNTVTVTLANHGLSLTDSITVSGVDLAIGGVAATALNGTFNISAVTDNTFSYLVNQTGTGTGLVTDEVSIDIGRGLINAFLSPVTYKSGVTAGLLAEGSSAQVGNRIDEKVTNALRNNLLGQPLDLATLNIIRGRDAGLPTLNEMRAVLSTSVAIPVALQPELAPYTSWTGFRNNLKGIGTAAEILTKQNATVKNFIMAYAADAILTQFATQAKAAAGAVANSFTTLEQWYTLRDSATATDRDAYMAGLNAAATAAMADATWMGTNGNKDYNRIDAWVGGLAEREVAGGMLGSTFDAVFAMQMVALQNGDRFYYLGRIPGTEFFAEMVEGSLFSEMVRRNTGASRVYADIFSAADSYVEIDANSRVFNTLADLQAATTPRTNILTPSGAATQASIGQAGYVGANAATRVFYGNSGNYLDARGVLNPNGVGNASEVIGGTAGVDRILALGGNDNVYAEGGNDVVDGGSGVDYLYGGDGDDNLDGNVENDFLYGEAGNDTLRGGVGIDLMHGGTGDDLMYGGLEADVMFGSAGNDVLYGGNGVVDPVTGILDPEAAGTGGLIDDNLSGGEGDDVLYGGGGWDVLNGMSGHDVLIPGAPGLTLGGVEALNGGEGDDIYLVESAADFVNQNFADTGLSREQRYINPGDAFRVGYGIGVDEVRLAFTTPTTVTLGLINAVTGLAQAFTGVERLVIGTGTLTNANTTGTAAINIDAQLAIPNPLPGSVVGLELVGNAGINDLIGTLFNDTLNGGAGADILNGLVGDDVYIVDNVGDQVVEGATGGGVDTVIVQGTFDYTLPSGVDPATSNPFGIENLTFADATNQPAAIQTGIGNEFDNRILGNGRANNLSGGGGDDTLNGGNGSDTLRGGAGIDFMSGGGDASLDFFVFSSVAEIGNNAAFRETISDLGANDVLDFTAIDANTDVLGTQEFTLIGNQTAFTAAGQLRLENGVLYGNVNADLGADFQIALPGVTALSDVNLIRTITLTTITSTGAIPGSNSILEGNIGSSSTHRYRASVPGGFAAGTVLQWQIAGTGANPPTASDFNGSVTTGTFTVPAGGAPFIDFSVVVNGDTTFEADESFTFTLINLPAGMRLAAPITSTILNDDVQLTLVNGTTGNDNLAATTRATAAQSEQINGLAGNDAINGFGGNDLINGGLGADSMTGGTGADQFLYTSINDSTATVRDTINDFNPLTSTGGGEGDVLDLSALGLTSFSFIGTANFTTNTPGQIRYVSGTAGTLLTAATPNRIEINTNADTVADMVINLPNTTLTTLSNSSFFIPTVAAAAVVVAAPVTPVAGQVINGTAAADKLNGGAGNDTITGGGGADQISGNGGSDLFVYTNVSDSRGTTRDTINDFVSGTDKIDLAAIDANTSFSARGNQAFSFIGSQAFTAPGQLRFANGVLQGNTAGTSTAELEILLPGVSAVTASDFIL